MGKFPNYRFGFIQIQKDSYAESNNPSFHLNSEARGPEVQERIVQELANKQHPESTRPPRVFGLWMYESSENLEIISVWPPEMRLELEQRLKEKDSIVNRKAKLVLERNKTTNNVRVVYIAPTCDDDDLALTVNGIKARFENHWSDNYIDLDANLERSRQRKQLNDEGSTNSFETFAFAL